MTAKQIIDTYISFFEKSPRNHKRIQNSPLVPENDPTTLFTSSGMQPLIPFLLGEEHPLGTRLLDVQNCFRAVDIEEVGDNRHTTFFRMLGNWSLGDYFKEEEIPWLWEFLTKELGLPKEKLYITVFDGDKNFKLLKKGKSQLLSPDVEAKDIWTGVLKNNELDPLGRIFFLSAEHNWWSRSGTPENMPVGEIGGPDTEVYYDFEPTGEKITRVNFEKYADSGRLLEIANSVFMQYKKIDEKTFEELPKQNVDFGGGAERLLAAVENKSDIFETSLFAPIIKTIEDESGKAYSEYPKEMQIITDHLTASLFIENAAVKPSNKEQGYVLRRLLRRAFDNFYLLEGENVSAVLEKIVEMYSQTDPDLKENFEELKLTVSEEEENYKKTLSRAKEFIDKRYGGKEVEGVKKISASDAFSLYSTHGLSPTQIRSLGYNFDGQKFAELMEKHQKLSRKGAGQKFAGGLADHSELTIMGHTATHLLHRALRDILGEGVHQTGSNITSERIRFDFNFDRNLTEDEITKVEKTVNGKIKENLPVHFEMMPLSDAKKTGAIGLFDEKYGESVKVYFIGPPKTKAYSVEFCGGPHVDFTGRLKRFKIIKQENLGKGQKRIYSKVNSQIA